MLFGSWAFLFVFLPLFLAASKIFSAPMGLLLFFSLAFYASWSVPFLALLLATCAITWHFGHVLAGEAESRLSRRANFLLALSILLLPLIWFKYSLFIAQNLCLLLNISTTFSPPALPPGISFYTFIQIAWLVGVYRGSFTPPGFTRYCLFSCFFPHVLSGPIVRWPELGPQFAKARLIDAENFAPAITLFTLGLAKKALLADSLAAPVDAVFNAAAKNWPLTASDAWLGSFGYSFQLYFDFSGYTDMALGLALMVGIRLPENFASPYRATGIVDFWRRWHITLGTWLRDFLYIPLGGNRKGKFRQYLNLFLTMLIGGIWHGAGWTYILWGAYHGLLLAVNHLYRAMIGPRPSSQGWRLLAIAFTFMLVNLGWVVFRSPSLDCALAMYKAMFAPAWSWPVYFGHWIPLCLCAGCALLCFSFPTSATILSGNGKFVKWQPTRVWAIAIGLLFALSMVFLPRKATFLYFQF